MIVPLSAPNLQMHDQPAPQRHAWSHREPQRNAVRRLNAEYKRDTLALSVSILPISRPLELSLQSTLQLSLTVLVCYRYRGRI